MDKDRIEVIFKEVWKDACKKFPKMDSKIPPIKFFTDGRKAGTAARKTHTCSFNTVIAEHVGEDFRSTIIHEIAHIVQFREYPRAKQAHGPEFKAIDKFLGGRGKRCYDYDVEGVVKVKRKFTRYKAECPCGKEFRITKRLVQSVEKGQRYCLSCKGYLHFVKDSSGNLIQV